MTFGKLHRERPYGSRRAEDENGLSPPHLELPIDPLKRGQPRHGTCARLNQVQSSRDRRDALLVDRDVLRIEAAFRIARLVPVRAIANAKSSHPGALGDD